MKISTALIAALVLMVFAPALGKFTAKQSAKANLWIEYRGESFFNDFAFWSWKDPTHGFVDYQDQDAAKTQNLISVNDKNQAVLRADTSGVAGDAGRKAVRLQSKKRFNSGLFIFDVTHVPTGCGTWPAFWLVGSNWPNQGEIDIIEVVNNGNINAGTLHTGYGCSMSYVDTNSFTGKWSMSPVGKPNTNCDVQGPGQYVNNGCGVTEPSGSMGPQFNAQGGGVYAVNWNPDTGIEMWSFPRNKIPIDIEKGDPDVRGWGKPFANFKLGWECPNSMFKDHQIIINLTFCGDWAGSVFEQMCPGKGSCTDFVKNNPGEMAEAYWAINYLKVFSPQ